MIRVAVKPELLEWAMMRSRKDRGYLQTRFAKLPEWLEGRLRPTLKQLEAFAKATHTPVGYFFLPECPEEPLPIPDFRTMPQARMQRPSVDLLDTIYLCQQRQEWYREYASLYREDAVPFIGRANLQDDVVEVARDIRATLRFDLDERRTIPTWTKALRRFIHLAEDSGVLVMVSGVVGSNTSRRLYPEEFRGFALVDDLAPLVFINGKDTKAAQMFTLAHEIAHLWLGKSGVSDSQVHILPGDTTERWCNAVAAEILAPLDIVRQEYDPTLDLEETMQKFARRFKVSTLVVLRRLFDAGIIDKVALWDIYRNELDRLKKLRPQKTNGGDFYNTLTARASKRFVRALLATTLEGRTLFQDAFRMLGVRKTATLYEEAKRLGLR